MYRPSAHVGVHAALQDVSRLKEVRRIRRNNTDLLRKVPATAVMS